MHQNDRRPSAMVMMDGDTIYIGTAKACVQTVLALMIFGNDTTVNAMLGVLMTVLGSGIYAYVRMREEEASKAVHKPPAPVPLVSVAVEQNPAAEGQPQRTA